MSKETNLCLFKQQSTTNSSLKQMTDEQTVEVRWNQTTLSGMEKTVQVTKVLVAGFDARTKIDLAKLITLNVKNCKQNGIQFKCDILDCR
jgi:hypothetical protein